jgi:hypothetical protein
VRSICSRCRRARARAIGFKRASYALLTVGIFAASTVIMARNWIGRTMVDGVWELDATVPLAIGVVGMVTLVIVSVLGWTLVQTHDPAPARAGVPAREPAADGFHGTALARR